MVSSVTPIQSGLHGYLAADLSPPPGHGFGVSFYVTVWALLESPLSMFQVGLPSTWIHPENFDFTSLLCPIGTRARDEADKEKENENLPRDWIEQEKLFFRDVFQSIEGGLGFWGTTQFPTKSPKYRINGIPDCYTTRIGSPGWPFGEPKALADQAMGLAQLSNRILVPPDGIPFAPGSESDFPLLGVAWMALPFTDYDGYFHLQTKHAANKDDQESLYWRTIDDPAGFSSAIQRPVSDNAKHQLWKLVPSDRKGYFYLTTLEAQGGHPDGPIKRFGQRDDNLWKLIPAGEDYYYLQTSQSEARNEYLDCSADATMLPRSEFRAQHQLWRLVPQAVGNDVATGDSSWTLFLNSENFKGPVVFFPPTTWSRISKQNLPAVGRGLDARMASMGSPAMEFNTVPGLQASYGGKTYVRIPKLLFPTQPHENAPQLVTPLMQDITLYSREAIYAPVMSWFANGPEAMAEFVATGAIANRFESPAPIAFDQGGIKLQGLSELVEIVNLALPGDRPDCSWGLVWKVPPLGSGLPKGQFPEYFVDGVAVPPTSIPAETGLTTATFTSPEAGKSYVSPTSGAWTSPGPAGGPLTATLGDGTKVTYAWYRFVDQPALQNLNLTPKQKEQLQSRIELLHKNWPIGFNYIARPPRVISLVSVDPNLIVTPPKGLEAGYVPIVTKQELA
jgi:hypothetical protein